MIRSLATALCVVVIACSGAGTTTRAGGPGEKQPDPVRLPELGDKIVELGGASGAFPNPIRDLALSGDGKRVVVVDDKGIVRVRDVGSAGIGTEIGKVNLPTQQDEPVGLAFSPSSGLVAVGDFMLGIVVLDISNKSVRGTVASRRSDVSPIFLSESRIAVADVSSLRIVGLETGKDVSTFPVSGDRDALRSIAHSPKSGVLAACSFQRVMVWKPSGAVAFEKNVDYVEAVALSADGATLAYAAGAGSESVVLVDIATGSVKAEIPATPAARIWLSGDEVIVALRRYSDDPKLARYVLGTGQKRYGPPDASAEGSAVAYAASGAGAMVARGTELFRVDPKTFERNDPPSRHGQAVSNLALSGDDRWLVSTARDGLVLRWSLEKPSSPPALLLDKKSRKPHSVAISPDGKLVAMDTHGEYSGGLKVSPIEGGEPVFELEHAGSVSGLAFDGPDKLWIATDDGEVDHYDIREGERIRAAPLTPGRGQSMDSTYWEGSLILPSAIVFRPHKLSDNRPAGPALTFTLPDGQPAAELDDVSPGCRPFGPTEIVCPGLVRAKAKDEPRHVVRILDVKTGHVRLLEAPGPVLALAPSADRSVMFIVVASNEKSPNAATKTSLVVIDATRGNERSRKPLPESASALAATRSGHVLIGHPSGAIRMLKP